MSLDPHPNPNNLDRWNKYSQDGEDGILDSILQRCGQINETCVEFGASDGPACSNVANLIHEHKWNSVLIEGDAARCRSLVEYYAPKLRDVCISENLISFRKTATHYPLAEILEHWNVPKDFGVLSIDVDGLDYHVWEALPAEWRPTIVLVEYNPTFPNDVEYVQPYDETVFHGNAPQSIYKLALQKGYRLVAATSFNLVFILESHRPGLLRPLRLEEARNDTFHKHYVCNGYDGTMFLAKSQGSVMDSIPIYCHHPRRLFDDAIQVVPPVYRQYLGRPNV